MSTILNILLFIFILGLLVFVHEFGHFITAKRSGVYIYEFSIGMGPEVKSIKGKDGVKYSIRALPIGGFVQMAGEIYEDDDTKKIPKEKFMCNRPWYQRLVILCAGVFNNFLLAILILFVIGCIWGSASLEPKIGKALDNCAEMLGKDKKAFVACPAKKAGIKDGDLILSINDSKIKSWDKAQLFFLLKTKNNKYNIEVKHKDGKKEIITVKPLIHKDDDGNEIKVFGLQTTGEVHHGGLNAFKYAFDKFFATIDQMWLTVVSLINGKLSVKALSGPVGIYSVVGASRKAGLYSVLFLIAYLSINLGLMNILPIPALDGGHVLFLVIEKIIGRKVDERVESIATMIFFGLLILLMVYVSINDVIKLFT